MSFNRNRLRAAVEMAKPSHGSLDFFSQSNLRMPRSRAVRFEFGFFNNGTLDNLADVVSATLEVKPSTSAGVIDPAQANVMSRTVAVGAMNAALTADQWANDTGSPSYHLAVEFSEAETVLDMTGAVNNEKVFGWVLTAITSIGRVLCGCGVLEVVNDGGSGVASNPAPAPTYTFSDDDIRAMVATKLDKGVNGNGEGFTLMDRNGSGYGIRWWVEVPAGETLPVVQQTTIAP